MSATNRGGSRVNDDFYATESWVVDRFIEAWTNFSWLSAGNWLEPGAGDGAVIKAVNAHCGITVPSWTAVEIDPSHTDSLSDVVGIDQVLIENFLVNDYKALTRFDVAMGNPPFALAMEFVRHCRMVARYTVLLLRLDFLASVKRSAFMREDTPNVYVLPNRPSFVISASCAARRNTGCKWARMFAVKEQNIIPGKCPECGSAIRFSTTDSCDYAWFVWGPERRRTGELTVLAETPAEQRSVWK